MSVSAEGRVEHQNEPKRPPLWGRLGLFWCSTRPSADTLTEYNLNHFRMVLGVHVFPRQLAHFLTDMSNRVEHQKQNQPAIKSGRLVLFFVFNSAFGRHKH